MRHSQETSLSLKLAARFVGLLALVLTSSLTIAQQFSADLIRTKPQGAANSKVYISGDKVRFETIGQKEKNAVIMDLTKGTSMMVLPGNSSYVVAEPGRTPTPMPFFRPADVDDGCAAWEKLVSKPGTCSKVGEDTFAGRSAVKYKGTAANGDTGYAWVDRKLNFVIKWEGEKTACEFQNIQEGPQEASLFEIPAGYEKFDVAQAKKDAATKKTKPKPAIKPTPQ
jgi:hypothetical protein